MMTLTPDELRRRVDQIKQSSEDSPGQNDEHRRRVVVEAAVAAARNLIDAGSDGSVWDYRYLTAAAAAELAQVVVGFHQSDLLRAAVYKQAQQSV